MALRHRPASLRRLPDGSEIELPGRGRTWARVLRGHPSATPVLLLHGWTATADLNWAGVYDSLWPAHTVIAPDHHGHGRGLRREAPFSIADTADDAAALVRVLGVARVIVVGYSMGGAVAQEFARRHPELTAGLVLCATSAHFSETGRDRVGFRFLGRAAAALRPAPGALHRSVAAAFLRAKHGEDAEGVGWIADELASHDWPTVLEAGMAVGEHDSREWIGTLDVAAVVITTSDDRVVPTARQLALGRLIPGALIDIVRGGHDLCLRNPEVLAAAVRKACAHVALAATALAGASSTAAA